MPHFPDTRYMSHDLARWALIGSPIPPPFIIKQIQLASYVIGSGYKRFIETGTYMGWTAKAIRSIGAIVDTIELDRVHYENALSDFSKFSGISCHFGDSRDVLPEILQKLAEPAVFWLDGHYSGEGTAKGSLGYTPVAAELEALANQKIKSHIVLIDDIRGFGSNGYPSIDWVSNIGLNIVEDCIPLILNDSLILANQENHDAALRKREEAIHRILI